MSTPLLSVCLITYNHEKYIRQAIEGVLMQKVDFSWELIIAEDCSTDNTRAILSEYKEKYPDFINLILQEKNVGPARNWIDLMMAPKSEYVAYFEGDDYWIDPYKLQKQVDFLRNNENYSACFTNVDLFSGNVLTEGALKEKHKKDSDAFTVFQDLWIPTLTLVFRNECLGSPIPKQFIKVHNGDLFLFYLLAQKGKIGYLDFITGVYRKHENGMWSGKNTLSQIEKRIVSFELIREYFSGDKKISKILSFKVAENKWLKVDYFFNQRNGSQFLKNYLLFFFNYPILGIRKGMLLILKFFKK